jgi:hypothetical protein
VHRLKNREADFASHETAEALNAAAMVTASEQTPRVSAQQAVTVFCAIGLLLHAGCGSANNQRVSKPPESVRIEWEYASNRGGMIIDKYNTVYSINVNEVCEL